VTRQGTARHAVRLEGGDRAALNAMPRGAARRLIRAV